MESTYVLLKPLLTEKTTLLKDEAQQVAFYVHPKANKIEIKKAVEELFPGTKVKKVNTLNVRGQKRRQGANVGYTPSWKKAVVTLTEDSKEIEFFNDMM